MSGRQPRLIRIGEEAAPATAPAVVQRPAARHLVRTGPSGLLLGQGSAGPVAIRLFRTRPTRILLSVPEYVPWLLAFRSISLGAHLSIIAADPQRWQALVQVVQGCGGTADVITPRSPLPSQGRPYRPSLVIDDDPAFDGAGAPLGAWQALLLTEDAGGSGAVHQLRASDMAIVGSVEGRTADNLRRAYALNPRQTRLMQGLQANEFILAMPRRVVRVSVPPTQSEYRLLFG